jgi:hypothetical protein
MVGRFAWTAWRAVSWLNEKKRRTVANREAVVAAMSNKRSKICATVTDGRNGCQSRQPERTCRAR